jgi:hypothetical protein
MKTFKLILFAAGVLLLSLNVVGLFKSLRNPELYTEPGTRRVNDVVLSYPEFLEHLKRRSGEEDKEFAIRINQTVKDGFLHYWEDDAIHKYNLTVPVWNNYLLTLASVVKPKKYRKYEFGNYRRNLERGTGLCSTHCTVVKGVLNENGIEAELFDLGGHVVITAKVGDQADFILDPDYGIYIPFSIEEIEADPEITRPFYASIADQYFPGRQDRYTTDVVVSLYEKHRNHTYSTYNWFEDFSYVAIWIIPLLLISPFLYSRFRSAS